MSTLLFMLAITHAVVGASLFLAAPTPSFGYMAAFLSHPILDYIPHWDMKTRQMKRSTNHTIFFSLIDAFTGFALGFLLFRNLIPPTQLLLAMFLAQAFDWFEAPYTILNWKFPPFSWVKRFQHLVHQKLPFPDGLLTQIITVFFMLLILRI